MKVKLQGHIDYYGVSHNMRRLEQFVRAAEAIWRKWLNRRGADRRLLVTTWAAVVKQRPWVKIRIKHSLWKTAATEPRETQLYLW